MKKCPLQSNFEENREIARIKNPAIETNQKAEPNADGEIPIMQRAEYTPPLFNGF